jgi:hypothetical protein
MKGWLIFSHSLNLVFSNLDVAFRVSAVLYGAYAVASLFLFQGNMAIPTDPASGMPMMDGGAVLSLLATLAVQIIVSVWIAIAWHRFVLMNERPAGFLPDWPGAGILTYFGWSMGITFLVFLAMLPVGLIIGLVSIVVPAVAVLMPVVMVAVAVGVFYRLAPVLPGIAVGRQVTLGEAWRATDGQYGSILAMAGFAAVLALLVQVPLMIGGDSSSIIATVYSLVIGWFSVMIGSSVLTTLYGHYIEGRELG